MVEHYMLGIQSRLAYLAFHNKNKKNLIFENLPSKAGSPLPRRSNETRLGRGGCRPHKRDAYVDHPAFANAVIARVIEAAGIGGDRSATQLAG